MSEIRIADETRSHFKVFRCGPDGQAMNPALLASDDLRDVLAFEKNSEWDYVFEYHHRFYSYSEFKRLVESGEIV